MNRHALDVLEFDRVLEIVAGWATSELGQERVRSLAPLPDLAKARAELERVDALARFLERFTQWFPPPFPDARAALEKLSVPGGVLEASELRDLAELLGSARRLKSALSEGGEDLSALDGLSRALLEDKRREDRLWEVVDPEGTVRDSASRELARIRRELRGTRNRIVKALEAFMRSLPERFQVPDASVTVVEGRYAVPVRREGRGEVGGIVLDESGTGATLYVEPPLALRLMSELRALEREEQREVRRILREESELLRPLAEPLRASQEAIVDFDCLYARARAALAWEARAPELLADSNQGLRIVRGRHPLLLARGEGEVVPFDLSLEPDERVLIVSGPNTGGKSVFLKAVGLLAALARSGVIPPVGEGTRLPAFREVYADIGDEQSISESLSTFSAHLANLLEILRGADANALVLIDEMGTGTDPQEGAALARAILDELRARGTLTVASSHLGPLKRLDLPGSGVVNASLQFDADRLQPTYRLEKGLPGRSYGLAIARRLGLPPEVLDRAEAYLPAEELRMEELLEALERKGREAEVLLDTLAAEKEETRRLRAELQRREEELRSRERTATERAREEARRMLLDARREVEAAIEQVRAAGSEGPAGGQELAQASREARRRVERAAQRHRKEGRVKSRHPTTRDRPPRPGERVRLSGAGSSGVVLEVREGRATVEMAGARLQVPLGDVEVLPGAGGGENLQREPTPGAGGGWVGPEAEARAEVDLRGLRVVELDRALDRALDQAVLGGLSEIRLIHGKGTGALRARVAELLEGDPRVRDFRPGVAGEGGAGVTLVRLR